MLLRSVHTNEEFRSREEAGAEGDADGFHIACWGAGSLGSSGVLGPIHEVGGGPDGEDGSGQSWAAALVGEDAGRWVQLGDDRAIG